MNSQQIVHVFQLASDYLNLNEGLQLLCINKYFYEHLPNSLYKRIIVQNALALILSSEAEEIENTEQILEMLGCTNLSYDSLYESVKSAENLVKNPYGEEDFTHWTRYNGGDGWIIDNWGTYNNRPRVFVSSYVWGKLTQSIKLPELTNRFLLEKTIMARRSDCGAEGQLIITFNNGMSFSTGVVRCPDDKQETDTNFTQGWKAITVKCRVPDDVISVELTLRGKDTQFWSGHYGARFGMTSLRIFRTSN